MEPELIARLDRIEVWLDALIGRQTEKPWYNTADFAQLVGRKPWTVRDWCQWTRIVTRLVNPNCYEA